MQNQLFNQTMTEALRETGSPDWERKKRVAKEREARVVVTKEVRSLIKEVASRNKTNQQTVVWLAMQKLWKYLQYSRRDYDEIMKKHTLPEFLKLSPEELREVANVVDEIDSYFASNGLPTSKEDVEAINRAIQEKLSALNEPQIKMCTEFIKNRDAVFGTDKIMQGEHNDQTDATVERFVSGFERLDPEQKDQLVEVLEKKGIAVGVK